MTHEKLLSLSDMELEAIAKENGILANLDRKTLLDELTEELDPINKNSVLHASLKRYEFTLNEPFVSKRLISYIFPKYYNQNSLHCVLRDPYWVFVDWEIEKNSYQSALKSSSFNGFFLRITALEGSLGKEKMVDFSDLSIKEIVGHVFIQLINPLLAHKVALFADLGGVEAMLIQSLPIHGSYCSTNRKETKERSKSLRMIAERPLRVDS